MRFFESQYEHLWTATNFIVSSNISRKSSSMWFLISSSSRWWFILIVDVVWIEPSDRVRWSRWDRSLLLFLMTTFTSSSLSSSCSLEMGNVNDEDDDLRVTVSGTATTRVDDLTVSVCSDMLLIRFSLRLKRLDSPIFLDEDDMEDDDDDDKVVVPLCRCCCGSCTLFVSLLEPTESIMFHLGHAPLSNFFQINYFFLANFFLSL